MNKFLKVANSAVGNFIFIVICSLAFMSLTPLGSLNPKEFGFYWSILTALIINFSTVYLIRKYQKDDN